MKKEKNVPLKNYVILSVILVLSIIIIIYFYMWYNTYEENKLNTPIMNNYMQVINYNELGNYLSENKDAVIYTSILKKQKIRNFEKNFKKLVVENSLQKKILYLDLTKEIDNKKKYQDIKNTYTFNKDNMTNIPAIIIFKEGKITSIYDIDENNYNIDLLEKHFEKEGIIDD